MHTSTPWVFRKGDDNTDGDRSLGSIMGKDIHIARIWDDQENASDDAALIVKAVNGYQAMKEALKTAMRYLSEDTPAPAWYEIEDALALAEGKEN